MSKFILTTTTTIDPPNSKQIELKNVRAHLLDSDTNTYSIKVDAEDIDGVQDALFLSELTQKTRELFVANLKAIHVGSYTYPLNRIAKSILASGKSSFVSPVSKHVLPKQAIDAEAFIMKLATELFTSTESDLMGARLVAGQEPFLTRTDKSKFSTQKRKYISGATETKMSPLEIKMLVDYLLESTTEERVRTFEETGTVRIAYAVKGMGRLRITIGTQRSSNDITFRRIPDKFVPLQKFHLSEAVLGSLCSREPGLYVVVGKPGSGKTALIAGALNHIAANYCLNIETAEDPIEYTFKHQKSMISQIEIGEDIDTMENTIKKLMTDDPDLVYITEIRSAVELRAAARLANMGIKVLSTYHSTSVADTLMGMKTMLKEDTDAFALICANIKCIIYQDLLPKKDGTGVTPVHGIFLRQQGQELDAKTVNESVINSLCLKLASPNKDYRHDVYNLLNIGVLDEHTVRKYTAIDFSGPEQMYKMYDPAIHIHNYPTIFGR